MCERGGGARYRVQAQDPQVEVPSAGRGHVAQEEAHLLQEDRQQDDGQAGRYEEEPQFTFYDCLSHTDTAVIIV